MTLSRTSLTDTLVWAMVTLLVAVEIVEEIRAASRRVSDRSNAWLTVIERRERRNLRTEVAKHAALRTRRQKT